MRTMILAAGLGTRLHPLTTVRPKVLMPLHGVPVLDFWIEKLHRCGFESALLNAFHLKEKLMEAVSGRQWPIPVEVHCEPVLLGTGGGIRAALQAFDSKPFAVINGDIVCDASIDALYEQHVRSGAMVSLLLHDYPEFNNVAVAKDGSVLGFGNEAGEISRRNGTRLLAFTGIHFISPSALADSPPGAPADILSIYRRLIARGTPPRALFQPGLFWREMGSVQSYMRLNRELGRLKPDSLPPLPTGQGVWIHPDAEVASGTEIKGMVAVGRHARVCPRTHLENVILWDDVRVEPGSILKNCIVADGMRISGIHTGQVLVPEENGGND